MMTLEQYKDSINFELKLNAVIIGTMLVIEIMANVFHVAAVQKFSIYKNVVVPFMLG